MEEVGGKSDAQGGEEEGHVSVLCVCVCAKGGRGGGTAPWGARALIYLFFGSL